MNAAPTATAANATSRAVIRTGRDTSHHLASSRARAHATGPAALVPRTPAGGLLRARSSEHRRPPATPRGFNDEIVMIMASWLVTVPGSAHVRMTARERSVTHVTPDPPSTGRPAASGARNGWFRVHRGSENAMVCETITKHAGRGLTA